MKKIEPRRLKPSGEITTPRLVIGLIDGVGKDLRRRYMPDSVRPEEAAPPADPVETRCDADPDGLPRSHG